MSGGARRTSETSSFTSGPRIDPPDDEAHEMERRLRPKKFASNALMAGMSTAWWPDHALGHGAPVRAHEAVKLFADHVSNTIGITPNYRRVEVRGWFNDPADG